MDRRLILVITDVSCGICGVLVLLYLLKDSFTGQNNLRGTTSQLLVITFRVITADQEGFQLQVNGLSRPANIALTEVARPSSCKLGEERIDGVWALVGPKRHEVSFGISLFRGVRDWPLQMRLNFFAKSGLSWESAEMAVMAAGNEVSVPIDGRESVAGSIKRSCVLDLSDPSKPRVIVRGTED